MRVVSLLPAATEIVCALGLRESLVGRSHECDFPESVSALPALTRSHIDSSLSGQEIDEQVRQAVREGRPLYELDEERLAALWPDVVVTQAACEVCAIGEGQVGGAMERRAPRARLVSLHPTRLEEVLEDVSAVGSACGVDDAAHELRRGWRDRLARVRRPRVRPRVALVEWLDPPMLAGHWVPDMIAAAGGQPLGPRPGERFAGVTWDEVAALRPDALVVAPCGFDLERTVEAARPWRDRLHSLAPRVLLLDGNAYVNRPGPRVVDAVEIIGAWLDGQAPDPSLGAELATAPAG
jgi:iron complex transport system substrate-binding protein